MLIVLPSSNRQASFGSRRDVSRILSPSCLTHQKHYEHVTAARDETGRGRQIEKVL